MSSQDMWTVMSPSAVRAQLDAMEAEADRRLAAAEQGALSEAAARDALALRHGVTSPAMLGIVAQAGETALLALAMWGACAADLGLWQGLLAGWAGALAATTAARVLGAYRVGPLRSFAGGFVRAVAGLAAAAAAASGVAMTMPDVTVNPPLAAMAGIGAVALFFCRGLIAPVADWCVEAGVTERRAVLVGGGPNAERVIRGLDAAPDNDIRIVGIFDDRDDERSPPLVAGARKLGGIAELIAFARIAHIDMLIITLPLEAEKRILTLLGALWVLPVDIRLSAIAQDFDFRRRGDAGMIDVIRQPMGGGQRLRKRALDVVVASLAIVALSPVMLLTALAVKLDSPGPVFFRQKRHGYNDRVVDVLKFRSMRTDACDPTARKLVTKGDARVTRVGRFIRKTSIDELPQLFNVLKGDLSLVGPRPHVVGAVSSQAQTFADIVTGYSGRHRAPPGITGWAQINGWRGEIDDPEKLRKRFEHDLYYIENWSIWFDLYILAMTPIRLFRTENAY
jgi:Undecaprenyl-phosphate glucose phosphotransferase